MDDFLGWVDTTNQRNVLFDLHFLGVGFGGEAFKNLAGGS